MKVCTKCGEMKTLTEFGKSKLGAMGLRADCRACVKRYDASRPSQKRNKESNRRYAKKHYQKNADVIRGKRRIQYAENPEAGRSRSKKWRLINPDRHCAAVMARDARKLLAMSGWADAAKILAFYEESKRLTLETGVQHNVDHIIPLRGKHVCGLHNEFNLRVITAFENRRKYNLHESTRRAEMRL